MRVIAFAMAIAGFSAAPKCMTLNSIVESMKAQAVLDTFEVDISTTMDMQGQSISVTSHLICKGPEKQWMEQKSSLGTMRTIRNGDKAQSIDMRTGKSQNLNLSEVEKMTQVAPDIKSFLSTGKYSDPKAIGQGLYEVALVPGSDPGIQSRTITYDERKKSLCRIVQIGNNQDTTESKMIYGKVAHRIVLSRLNMDVHVNGLTSRIDVAYSNYTMPTSISDAIFQIRE